LPSQAPAQDAVDAEDVDFDSFIKNFERLMPRFGLRFARSPEDDRLVSAVLEYMKKSRENLPGKHRFVVSGRAGDWRVAVLDMEAIWKGERPQGGLTYHVGNRSGRLRMLYVSL
jgi:hypothetical protein